VALPSAETGGTRSFKLGTSQQEAEAAMRAERRDEESAFDEVDEDEQGEGDMRRDEVASAEGASEALVEGEDAATPVVLTTPSSPVAHSSTSADASPSFLEESLEELAEELGDGPDDDDFDEEDDNDAPETK